MPDKWLRAHPHPTLDEIAAEVSRLHHEADKAHRTTKVALAALLFAVLSSAFVWVYASRVAEQAKADAVVQAEQARRESVRGLCVLIGNLYTNPNGTAEGRQLLTDTYVYLGCLPPLPPPPK